MKSGVPLGGIGAGKIEILPNGCWHGFTFLNNTESPTVAGLDKASGRATGIPGFHFALAVTKDAQRRAVLLQTEKIMDLPLAAGIQYDGIWPQARLQYDVGDPDVEIGLTAVSPVAPGDRKISALPAAVFRFRIANRGRKELRVSLMGIIRNMVGIDEISRLNRVEKDARSVSVVCSHSNPFPGDAQHGEYALTVPREGDVSWLGQWNMQTKNFVFGPELIRLTAFDLLRDEGRLPSSCESDPQRGGSAALGAALAVEKTIEPGSSTSIDFIFSWHFPHHHAGHIYEKHWRSAVSAGRHALRDRARIIRKSDKWLASLDGAGLPDWLKDALFNNLYVLSSTTWWDRKGNFAFYEAPVICPLMGTLDVRYYATVPFARMFPEFDKSELMLFAKAQRANGYIPHDLGRNRLDNPNDGTTHFYWKDLNAKFVLQIYRDALWLKDRTFLEKIYPAAKRALLWSLTTDSNGDHLPDNQGADQTYDVWEFFGTNSYTSSIFLASLLAFEKLAVMMKDRAMARLCRDWFEKGRTSFIEQLWNGKYFVAVCSGGETYPASIAGQLNGQWYAHLLNLGYLFPKEMVQSAVREITRLNGSDSPYGVTNSIFPDGKRDASNAHASGIWPGESYAVAALAIYEGYPEVGLEIAKKTWENMTAVQKNPWNQPDVVHAADGTFGFGDSYMRNMAIWAVAEALGSSRPKLCAALRKAYRGG